MRFSNKTIDQLAEQTINGENSIELEINTNLEMDEPEPLDRIGVEVDAYSDLKPFEDDEVVVTLWMKRHDGLSTSYLNLDIEDAEKLGNLLLFQCKVARRAKEKKRLLLKHSEQTAAN